MFRKTLTLLILFGLLLAILTPAQAPTVANASSLETPASKELKTPDKDLVVIQTNLGNMTMRLYPKAAPKMVAHFKKLVSEGYYNGVLFHRVIPKFMIQGGNIMTKSPDKSKWGQGRPGEETVPPEFHPELHHAPGIVAAARKPDPNSASTQFYICVGSPTNLDGQYTIFGELIDAGSLEVAIKISEVKRDSQNRPEVNVVMKKVFLRANTPTAKKPAASSKSKPGVASKTSKGKQ